MVELIRFVYAFVIVFLSYLSSYLITFLFDKIGHLVSKTETKLDDEIIQTLKTPIRILFILGGVFFGIYYLERDLKFNGVSVVEIFILIGILFVAYTFKRVISAVLVWYSISIAPKTKGKLDDHLFSFVRKIIAILIYLIASIIILDRLGIEITPLLAGLGVAGLAVALALQDTLSNFFSGVYILADKPIRIDDFIKLESGEEGFVRDIGWRSIRIETLPGDLVIIPNAKLSQSTIVNYSLPGSKERVLIPIGIDYSSNVELAEKTMIQAVKNAAKDGQFTKQYISKEFANNNMAITIFKGFGDSSLDFLLIYEITDYSKRGLVTTEINREVTKLFRRNKIEIPFPIRTIYMKKE